MGGSPAAERLFVFVPLEGGAQVVLVRHGERDGQRGRVSMVGVRGAAGGPRRHAEADAHRDGQTLAVVLSDIFGGLKERVDFVHGGRDPRLPKRPTEPGVGHLLARAAPPAPAPPLGPPSRDRAPRGPPHPGPTHVTATLATKTNTHAREPRARIRAATHTRPRPKTKEFRARFFKFGNTREDHDSIRK